MLGCVDPRVFRFLHAANCRPRMEEKWALYALSWGQCLRTHGTGFCDNVSSLSFPGRGRKRRSEEFACGVTTVEISGGRSEAWSKGGDLRNGGNWVCKKKSPAPASIGHIRGASWCLSYRQSILSHSVVPRFFWYRLTFGVVINYHLLPWKKKSRVANDPAFPSW